MTRIKTSTLVESLRKSIEEGEFPSGNAIPSERILSEQFGVSRTTIRRAIEKLVSTGLLFSKPGAGTFVTNVAPGAQGGQEPDQKLVGCIVPTLSHPFYGKVVEGFENEARASGFQVVVGQSNYDMSREADYLRQYVNDPAVRGAVLVPTVVDRTAPAAAQLQRSGKTLVYLGRWPDGAECDGIASNYELAGQQAILHLIGLGHRRIAYVEGLPHFRGFTVRTGYERALTQEGLRLDPDLVLMLDLTSEEAGMEAARQIRHLKDRPTAVFARNDVTAVGLVRGLRENGLDVPGDVAVVSVDNSDLARHLSPPLTSVESFAPDLGQQAFRLVHDRIGGGYRGPARRVTLDPQLVVRASCARPALVAVGA